MVVKRSDFCGKLDCPKGLHYYLPEYDDGIIRAINITEQSCSWAWYLADRTRDSVKEKETNAPD